MTTLARYFKRARSAITGRFISLKAALKRKYTSVVERVECGKRREDKPDKWG